ncbi:hypothetical protein D3C87_1796290 [compost metagenome]
MRQAAALRLEADVEGDIAGQAEVRLDLLAAGQFAEVDIAAARQAAAGRDLALDDDIQAARQAAVQHGLGRSGRRRRRQHQSHQTADARHRTHRCALHL